MGNSFSADLTQESHLCNLILQEDCGKFLEFLHVAAASGQIEQTDCSFEKFVAQLALHLTQFRERLSLKSNNVVDVNRELETLDKYSNWHKFCIRELQKILELLPGQLQGIISEAFNEGHRVLDTLDISSYRHAENVTGAGNFGRDSIALFSCKEYCDGILKTFQENVSEVNGFCKYDMPMYMVALRNILYTICVFQVKNVINVNLKEILNSAKNSMFIAVNRYIESTAANPNLSSAESIGDLLSYIFEVESTAAATISEFLSTVSASTAEPSIPQSINVLNTTKLLTFGISSASVLTTQSTTTSHADSKYIHKLQSMTDAVFQQIILLAKTELRLSNESNAENVRRFILSRENAKTRLFQPNFESEEDTNVTADSPAEIPVQDLKKRGRPPKSPKRKQEKLEEEDESRDHLGELVTLQYEKKRKLSMSSAPGTPESEVLSTPVSAKRGRRESILTPSSVSSERGLTKKPSRLVI